MSTVEDRFWPKLNLFGPIARPGLTPCWVWTASTRGNKVHSPNCELATLLRDLP